MKELYSVRIMILLLASSFILAMSPKPQFPNLWPILRIIDSDVIVIRLHDQIEQIKLLHVNAPKVGQKGYEQAMKTIKNLLHGGRVFLELENDKEMRDRYGRLLAYVYLDGHNINLEMIRSGWAKFQPESNEVSHAQEFTQAEEEAQKNGLGLWALNSKVKNKR